MPLKETDFFKFIPGPGETLGAEPIDWARLLPSTEPGPWAPAVQGTLVCGENGYHVCRKTDLLGMWCTNLYVVEVSGDVLECKHAVLAREMRLTQKVGTWNHANVCRFAYVAVERAASGRVIQESQDDLMTLVHQLRDLLRESEELFVISQRDRLDQDFFRRDGRLSAQIDNLAQSTEGALRTSSLAESVISRLVDGVPRVVRATYWKASWHRLVGSALESLADAVSCMPVRGDLTDESTYIVERRWQEQCLWNFLCGQRFG